jgi:MerR family transcriptional regulator, light-induced transcriptional regulator
MRHFAQAASPQPAAGVDGTGTRRRSAHSAAASTGMGPVETLVASVVIPHVAQARRRAPTGEAPRISRLQGADIAAFAEALLSADDSDARRAVESLLAEGASVDDVADSFLAPAARLLGARWEDDTLSFAAVSTGMTRLHVLLHMMGRRFHAGGLRTGRRLLMANNPGERHAFGPLMVAEHFRRAGWDSRFDPTATTASIVKEVGTGTLDVVGLSCAAERYLDDLQRCIRAVRAARYGRQICLLVGGKAFSGRPELARRVGADATAQDAPGALAAVARLLPAAATTH